MYKDCKHEAIIFKTTEAPKLLPRYVCIRCGYVLKYWEPAPVGYAASDIPGIYKLEDIHACKEPLACDCCRLPICERCGIANDNGIFCEKCDTLMKREFSDKLVFEKGKKEGEQYHAIASFELGKKSGNEEFTYAFGMRWYGLPSWRRWIITKLAGNWISQFK